MQPDFARDDDGNGDPDGSDSNAEGRGENFGAQHVIALIDCHPDMFVAATNATEAAGAGKPNAARVKDGGGIEGICTPFDMSLQLIKILMQQTIEQTVIRKTGKRNGVGLFLYNTNPTRKRGKGHQQQHQDEEDPVDDDDKMDDEDDDNGMAGGGGDTSNDDDEDDDSDAPNQACPVHELLDLIPPGIQHVQSLQDLLEKRDRLKEEFCPSMDEHQMLSRIAPLQTAIEEATRKFVSAKCVKDPNKSTKENEIDHRSIWIFTNQADPYPHESMKELVRNVANEAKEQGIKIVVWPLLSPTAPQTDDGHNASEIFELPFFGTLVSEPVFEQRLRTMTDLEDGLDDITRSMTRNRRSYFGPMHVLCPNSDNNDEGTAIMIDWYPIVQLATRPSKVQIDGETKR
jgi:Ku70/Ku80 N-terminal alpha/beta domain